jgi:sulfonate transport system substrate-binding protein
MTSEKNVNLKKIRIGYLTQDPLIALKELKLLESNLKPFGYTVEWKAFEDEVKIYQALEKKTLDFGKVGDAVPAFLHNGKNTPVYLAAEPSNPGSIAIAVNKNAEIKEIKDLLGKKVAYTKFSSEHYFLLEMLVNNGLGPDAIKEIHLIEAAPSEGMELVKKGEVDAAVVTEPNVSQLENLQFPLIFDYNHHANADIYLTTQENVNTRKDIVNTVLNVISNFDEFLTDDPHHAADLLFQSTKVTHAEWMAVFGRESFGSSLFFDGMIKEQQEKVDFLVKHKVIKENYQVSDYVVKLTEEE